MSDALEAAMRGHAEKLRLPAQYVGLFDFMLWSQLRQRAVQVLFGRNLVDLTTILGGPLSNVPIEDGIYIAAVRVVAKGRWLPAVGASPGINHWVIGVAHPTPKPDDKGRDTVSLARQAGLLLKPTESCGECGLDCLCYFEGKPRDRDGFQNMRDELADYLDTVVAVPSWQEVFRMGAEFTPAIVPVKPAPPHSGGMAPPSGGAPPALGSDAQPASSSSASSSSAGPPASPPVLPDLLAGVPADCAFAESPAIAASAALAAPRSFEASVIAALPLPPPLPPPSDPPPLRDSQEAEQPSAFVVAASSGPANFVEYLKSKPGDGLFKAIKDYKSFMAAQEVWEEHNPRRRIVKKCGLKQKNRSTTLKYRLATAAAYLEWRKGPGADVKDHIKARVWYFAR
jgi:hypothetical protein